MEGGARMAVVVIHYTDAFTRIAQPQLEIVVFQLSVAGAAVHPARQARVVRVDDIDLLDRLEPEDLETVLDAAQRKRIGVFRPSEAVFGDGDIGDVAAAARHPDQRGAGFIVGEVRNPQDIDEIGQSRSSARPV